MKLDAEALEFMMHTMQKFTGMNLSEVEQAAAAELLLTLPCSSTIKDFVQAAKPDAIARAGLPAELAANLAQLAHRLEHVPYAARWAALFDTRP